MGYDEALAQRVRSFLRADAELKEVKMFGGLAFLTGGNMALAVGKDGLLLRVPREEYAELLADHHVRRMEMGTRTMRGFVRIDPAGVERDQDLRQWVERGFRFASSLPPK